MTEPPDSTPEEHISDEDVAAFLEHQLSPQRKDEVITHLAQCPRCRMLVTLLERSLKSVPNPKQSSC
jgi:hypothetical protein